MCVKKTQYTLEIAQHASGVTAITLLYRASFLELRLGMPA